MKFTARYILILIGILFAAVAIILLLLPHDDRQSYNYELNQPWRYQLLTADFDMPILRDSTSIRQMRDSIDKAFIPLVKRDTAAQDKAIATFSKAIAGKVPHQNAHLMQILMKQVYDAGIVSSDTYSRIHGVGKGHLRIATKVDGADAVESINASQMMSPTMAFRYIDSLYRRDSRPVEMSDSATSVIARIVGASLTPNIVIDSVADKRYREQEYLTVNGALGVIKKGQRIVDRGEIISPQIFTNLNTYMQMAEQLHQEEQSDSYFTVGQVLYMLICFGMLYMYLLIFRRKFFMSIKKMTFLMTFVTAFVVFAVLMFEYLNNGIYYVSFAAVPVVLLVFFDARTAIFSLLITVLLSALVSIYPFQFIFLELTAGLTAAFTIHNLTQRSQLLKTALFTFLAYCVGYVVITLISDGNLSGLQWKIIGAFAINNVVLSFAYFIIFIVEKTFGFTSTVTLVELSDINNPLLRRLSEEAPGTFQHSMQVSTLAADAARAIGANTQLVRTGALYHDIGKLESPVFFTENQHGVNPHSGLNPETSARKIISHVTAGLALANKAKLPAVIKDFIAEHHGKSVTRYFYNTAINNSPDGKVDKSKFTYPGPNPQTRETAILMMADSVEAASRSLKDYSPQAINNLVDKIIAQQQADGLYNESPISFHDLQVIKETFKKRLSTIYHSRIAYPEIKKPTAEDKAVGNKEEAADTPKGAASGKAETTDSKEESTAAKREASSAK